MSWNKRLGRWDPASRNYGRNHMSLDPGTERAVVGLNQTLPSVLRQLERLNQNLGGLEKLADLPKTIVETFRELKSLFTEIESDGSCQLCSGRGWWLSKDPDCIVLLCMCHDCQKYPDDIAAAEAALPTLQKMGVVVDYEEVYNPKPKPEPIPMSTRKGPRRDFKRSRDH